MNSLDNFIRHHYGSRAEMERQLELPHRTIDRWYRKHPHRFLTKLKEISEQTGVPREQVAITIMNHVDDTTRPQPANHADAAPAATPNPL